MLCLTPSLVILFFNLMEYLTKNLAERGHSSLYIQTLALRCARCVSLQYESFFLNFQRVLRDELRSPRKFLVDVVSKRDQEAIKLLGGSSAACDWVGVSTHPNSRTSTTMRCGCTARSLSSTTSELCPSRCVAVRRIFLSFSCTDTLHFRDVEKNTSVCKTQGRASKFFVSENRVR